MSLAGKTPQQIAEWAKDKSHPELVIALQRAVAAEPLFTAAQIAELEQRRKVDVLKDIKAGRYVDPVLGAGYFSPGENSKKVSASALNNRRAAFFVPVTVNEESNGR